MHNVVLSQIDPEKLINSISERVTANILKAVISEQLPTEAPDQLFTTDEAAEFLNLTKPTIYSKVSRGELPYMKRGKKLHFSRKELLDYLKEGRQKTNTEVEVEAETYLSHSKRNGGRANG